MRTQTAQNLLSARYGTKRLTIGLDEPEALRRLSDARALSCPGCGEIVVLHAGTVRTHHFAHLPGAVCSLPQTEPETEEHRAGKLQVAQWLRACLPGAEVILEAIVPETGQRADVLAVVPATPGERAHRIALEYQCASLSAREWRRRHQQYRVAEVQDLWLLGGSRLHRVAETKRTVPSQPLDTPALKPTPPSIVLRTTELERALQADGAPILFLDAEGIHLPAGSLARFRPVETTQVLLPEGRLSVRPLETLAFPWNLLGWSAQARPDVAPATPSGQTAPHTPGTRNVSDEWIWEWMTQRFHVTRQTLPAFFGLNVVGQEVFACSAATWQAAVYFRFIHCHVGEHWWLQPVEVWARTHLPLTEPIMLRKLQRTLADYQEVLAAAGMLSLPMGHGRVHAQVTADLTTLSAPPDREEVLRLVRYRRTLSCEANAMYRTGHSG